MGKIFKIKKLLMLLLSIVVLGGTYPNELIVKKVNQSEIQVQYSTDSTGLDVGKAD